MTFPDFSKHGRSKTREPGLRQLLCAEGGWQEEEKMGQHCHPTPSAPRDAALLPRGHCFSHQGRQHMRLSMSAKHPRARTEVIRSVAKLLCVKAAFAAATQD